MTRTFQQIMRMSPEQRRSEYTAVDIGNVIIDGNTFTNYGTYSFLWEKSYVKSPTRSNNGSISNLDSYTTFVTGHFKINFSIMSIDDYRKLMQLLYAKNEHTVTCYDIVFNKRITLNMYFTTEEMPKLYTLSHRVQSMTSDEWEDYVELLGVQDLTVEMVGTNTEVANKTVTYHLNPPVSGYSDMTKRVEIARGEEYYIGTDANMQSNTFGNRYKFAKWNTKADGTELNYIDATLTKKDADNKEIGKYTINFDLDLYAQWDRLG